MPKMYICIYRCPRTAAAFSFPTGVCAANSSSASRSCPACQRDLDSYMTVVSDSHYQFTLDAVYVYVVPWSEFPIVPSYPHYPHPACPTCQPSSSSSLL